MKAMHTKRIILAIISATFLSAGTLAQQASVIPPKPANATVLSNAAVPPAASAPSESTERERKQFEQTDRAAAANKEAGGSARSDSAESTSAGKTNVNVLYQGYNFNGSVERINLLRAYDPDAVQEPKTSEPEWHYGGFVDAGYLLDFNHPANDIFRGRGTAWHVDDLHLNMAGAYVKKDPSETSRWGAQLAVQGGKDCEVFGFSATAPNIDGFKWLRHLGPTNVSYLAPVGKGLTVQGGIFGSLIGYDSLYARDNFNYTRPWEADFTPYFMLGVDASYPFTEKLTGTLFVVNGYWHLANANSVPSSGGQIAYKASPRVTVKETVLWGPHQTDTSLKYWRSLSDTIVERSGDRVTFAFEYIYSSERVVAPGDPRALMMAAHLPVRWTLNKRWSASVRPEVFWDRDGRWTLARQTVKAITTTLEYRIPYKETNTILRLEHRWDDSRGPDGGFFRGAEVAPGVIGLTPTQHLLIFGLIFTFDH
ncbi:MAG: outer membrane beta-barrel protein [Acidobacteriota bacterium]